jgi:type I restriction enzyme S subunit
MPVSFARMAAVSESKPEFDSLEVRNLGEVRKGFTHFAEGDVLFAKITPCMENGKGAVATGLQNGIGCGTTELHVIRPLGGIDPHYVYRFLAQSSVRQAAKENFTGTAGQSRVPTVFIEDLELPLAPLAEQRRIVAKLEKLLGQGDACQQRLVKLPTLLKRFRQSILAAACSGRLTADWREEHPVPEADTTDGSTEGSVDLPETWQWRKIGNLFTVETGTTPPKKQPANYSPTPGACPFFKPTDLDVGAQVREAREWLSEQGEEYARLLPAMTVCVTSIGATIGKTGLLRVRGATNQQINSILPTEGVQPEFTFSYCCSPYFQRRIVEESSSTTLPIINKSRFEELEFPLPPFPEQQEIVRRVESLFALADQLELRLKMAVSRVCGITPALLARAFSGKLVPQDPTDEPAEKLLERIKAAKKD